MKKLLILLLSLTILLSMAACSEDPVDTPTEPTQPQTKTVYVHSSVTHTHGTATSRTEYLYDDAGLLTATVVYTGEEESRRFSVTCDENGNPIRWVANVDGTESATEYTYDNEGRNLGTYIYTDGKLVTSTESTWVNGRRVSVLAKAPSQNFESRSEYTYDENGNMIRQDLYVNGQLSSYAIYTCDEQNRPVSCDSYTVDGTPSGAVAYAYDGNTETRTSYDTSLAVTQITVLTYDEHGNLLTSTTSDNAGKVLSSEVHTWKPVEVPIDSPRASV